MKKKFSDFGLEERLVWILLFAPLGVLAWVSTIAVCIRLIKMAFD
jgi:hypothetical protein